MHVFTYGSLMFPEVWRRVTGGLHAAERARLADHARHAIRGVSYPGVTGCPGAAVDGVLYRDVDAAALAALDAFEGPEYRRATVTVTCENGDTVEAGVYLYLVAEKLSESPWDAGAFDIAGFISMHCA